MNVGNVSGFNTVTTLKVWVSHVLPLVYDDTLSFMELLGKVTYKLNELIENNNKLPDYIADLIREYISSGEIEKVLAEVLANYMLNVKFPPAGLTPATGDGSADDTEAIQGCIDYAFNHGGMAIYFPSGSYLTQPLVLKNKCTMFGYDRYNTRLVLKGGATTAMFTGNVDELTLTGMGFDGNMDIQVNNVNLFDVTVGSAIITNVLLTDGYDLLKVVVNRDLQLDDVIFNHAVENGLVVSGNGYVQADNVIFKSVSALIGKNYVVLGCNDSILTKVKCEGASPNGVRITGNNNVVKMWNEGSTTAYVDEGQNNSVEVYTVSDVQKFSGSVEKHVSGTVTNTAGSNISETVGGKKTVQTVKGYEEIIGAGKTVNVTGNFDEVVSGDKGETAMNINDTSVAGRTENTGTNKTVIVKGNDSEDITGTKVTTVTGKTTENANGGKVINTTVLEENLNSKVIKGDSVIETLTGNKTVTSANTTENVSGDKTVNAGDITETLTGNKTVTSANTTENVSGDKTVNAGDITETLTGNKTVTSANTIENVSGDKTVNAGDVTETSKNRTMAIEENYTLSAKGIEVNSIDIGSIINYNYKHYLIAIEPDLTSVFNNVTDSTLILLSPDVVYTVGTCTINSSNVCIMGASNVKKAVIKLTGNISVLGIESGVFKDGFSIINVELNGNNRAFDFIIKFRNRSVISSCNFINFNHCLHIEQSNIISIDRSLFRYSNYGLYAPKSAVGESYSNEILVVDSSFNDNYNTCCFAYGGGAGTKHTFRNCTFEIAQGESDIYKFDYENVTLVLDGAYIEDNYYTVRTNGIYVHNGATLWFVNSNVNNILQVIKCTDSYAHVYNNKIINCTRVAEITNGGPYTFHSNGNYFYGMEVPYLNHSDFNNIIGSSYLPNIGTNIPIYKTTIGESKQQIFTYPYLGNGYISLVIGANKQAVCPIIPVPDLPNSLSIDMSVFEVGDVVYIYLIEIKLNHVILGEKSPFVF